MSAPLKVLIGWVSIVVILVVVVFYRYDLIDGIKRTMGPSAPTVAPSNIPTKNEASSLQQEHIDVSTKQTMKLSYAEVGKKLFEEKTCALCHGTDGKANTPTGQAMNATNLTSGKFHSNKTNMESKAYILKVLEEGVPGTGMMSFKTQIPSEADRNALADYVLSLSSK